jgi:carbon-monoxide dehydrogenase large subunit
VLAVFTGRDLANDGVGAIPTLIAERGGGIRSRDGSAFAEPPWHPLAVDRVRHVGEPVAMVVGATPASARDGADAVRVQYAPRPAVVDARAALADGAPLLHDGVARNRAFDWECGDAAAAARALDEAVHVTRLTLMDNRLATCFMEPRAALAEWDASTGRCTLHASTQSVHRVADHLGRVLGVPRDRVRCVTGDVGGGFGSKIQPYPEYAAVAWAARRLARPMKWVSSRSEGFVSDAQSRDQVLAGELALDAAGRITALRVHAISDQGAYVASGFPISIVTNMERMVSGLYAIPAVHLRVEGAFTNTVPINVYRGVGRLECVYAIERLIDRAARETGRDPADLRRDNMVRTFPHRTATGAVYDSGDYVARLDEAIQLADLAGFSARRAESARRGMLRGLGLGPYTEGTGGLPQEFAARPAAGSQAGTVLVGGQRQGRLSAIEIAGMIHGYDYVTGRRGLPSRGDSGGVSRALKHEPVAEDGCQDQEQGCQDRPRIGIVQGDRARRRVGFRLAPAGDQVPQVGLLGVEEIDGETAQSGVAVFHFVNASLFRRRQLDEAGLRHRLRFTVVNQGQ